MTSSYAEVLSWLYALDAARGMDFKLERVALALMKLGQPQQRFASIHIAGTNGKGSVAAMLHAIFDAAGYRVGLYTSPHLVDVRERIRIGSEMINAADVVALTQEIRAAATVHGIELTFFEFMTVMAFLYFARRGIDLAIVEVGLGGRLDATNVIDPEVAVITTIGRDHEEFLGNSLASIAAEKAGIIKRHRPVVVGKVPHEADAVVRQVMAERQAPGAWLGEDFSMTVQTAAETALCFHGLGWAVSDIRLALAGRYQRENAATAVAAVALVRRRFPLSDEAVRRGLAKVRWPGRLDVVQAQPLVLLDGAHNADGIEALLHELPDIAGGRALHFLFAVMRDKSWLPMVEALARRAASVTVTTALPPRGEAAEEVARAFEAYCPVSIVPQPVDAIEMLLGSVDAKDAIVVTGSLFLIGALYPYFLSRRGAPPLFGAADGVPSHP
jgi:dihydrofolate synthase/folylpolyglutamate synthase